MSEGLQGVLRAWGLALLALAIRKASLTAFWTRLRLQMVFPPHERKKSLLGCWDRNGRTR
jgi:hypothetical protein